MTADSPQRPEHPGPLNAQTPDPAEGSRFSVHTRPLSTDARRRRPHASTAASPLLSQTDRLPVQCPASCTLVRCPVLGLSAPRTGC
ncbi:hypothetical protein NDU88_005105 [Pleurodeles waltl]|uniref:Uncharacterized protein n=1 Tax=Pleurodeles waltl TaxID=8319 RepID=A0AAV7PHM1_PLEWA|nr:hypothetical protein NDU88_005105 [Pleurodeles waltl]